MKCRYGLSILIPSPILIIIQIHPSKSDANPHVRCKLRLRAVVIVQVGKEVVRQHVIHPALYEIKLLLALIYIHSLVAEPSIPHLIKGRAAIEIFSFDPEAAQTIAQSHSCQNPSRSANIIIIKVRRGSGRIRGCIR